MRLIKQMYGSEFDRKSKLFELRTGQMRSGAEIAHNGGWYNQLGEKIGWGDLDVADVVRIRDGLLPGEVFIVLGEQDSFWKFVTHNPGIIGSMCSTAPNADAPGIDYVVEHARFAIFPGETWSVEDYHRGGEEYTAGRGEVKVTFKATMRESLKKRLEK